MKKQYISPTMDIVVLRQCYTLQAASGLDGFGGSGGKTGGKDADARRYGGYDWDDEEDDDEY